MMTILSLKHAAAWRLIAAVLGALTSTAAFAEAAMSGTMKPLGSSGSHRTMTCGACYRRWRPGIRLRSSTWIPRAPAGGWRTSPRPRAQAGVALRRFHLIWDERIQRKRGSDGTTGEGGTDAGPEQGLAGGGMPGGCEADRRRQGRRARHDPAAESQGHGAELEGRRYHSAAGAIGQRRVAPGACSIDRHLYARRRAPVTDLGACPRSLSRGAPSRCLFLDAGSIWPGSMSSLRCAKPRSRFPPRMTARRDDAQARLRDRAVTPPKPPSCRSCLRCRSSVARCCRDA
jgi:hypothetical protein